MFANVPIVSTLGLLASSVLAVQAVGTMGKGMEHWLRASESEFQTRAAAVLPPAFSAAPPPAPSGKAHQVPRAADGMFYLAASADAAPVRFLIDTGSTTTILTRSDAARLGLAEEPGSRRARTLAGEVRIAHARIGELRVAGRRFADVRVGVASDDLGVSLIGQDVLSRFESIAFEKDRATLR